MKFNGTAIPNKSIELVIEDPLGKEIVSDIIQVDNSGFVEFEFPNYTNISRRNIHINCNSRKDIKNSFMQA